MSDLKFELVKQVVAFGNRAVLFLNSEGFVNEAAKLDERVSTVRELFGSTYADRAAQNSRLSVNSDALLDRLAGLDSRATIAAERMRGNGRSDIASALSGLATLTNGAALAIEAAEA